MMPTDIPAAIRALREALGWSRDRLATRIGVRPATVTAYEAGTRRPGARELFHLALVAAESVECDVELCSFVVGLFHSAYLDAVGVTPEAYETIGRAMSAGLVPPASRRPRLVKRGAQ